MTRSKNLRGMALRNQRDFEGAARTRQRAAVAERETLEEAKTRKKKDADRKRAAYHLTKRHRATKQPNKRRRASAPPRKRSRAAAPPRKRNRTAAPTPDADQKRFCISNTLFR